MPDTTLVVMAAGIGSRYGGLKPMDPVGPGGEKIIDYSVYDARRAGLAEQVVFVIRKEMEDDFREHIGRRIERTDRNPVRVPGTGAPAGRLCRSGGPREALGHGPRRGGVPGGGPNALCRDQRR